MPSDHMPFVLRAIPLHIVGRKLKSLLFIFYFFYCKMKTRITVEIIGLRIYKRILSDLKMIIDIRRALVFFGSIMFFKIYFNLVRFRQQMMIAITKQQC